MIHKVFEHKLASGPQGLVIDVPGSAVVAIRVTFHSGFEFSPAGAYEVPHLLEHVLATVTKRHSKPNAFMIEAQKHGAYVNAETGAATNEYVYECAAFELGRILDLLEEQLCEPLLAEEPFEAERSNVREELTRNTTMHGSICHIQLLEQAWPKRWRGYAQRLEELERIELGQLAEHHRRTHTARNARFYIAGQFPDGGQMVAGRLERMFGRLPEGERLMLLHELGRGGKRPLVAQRDIDQLYYRTGAYFRGLDEQERSALGLLRTLMVGGMGSRVLGEARRRGLAYGVGAAAHAEPGNSEFGFAGYVTPRHASALFDVMTRQLREAAAGAIGQKELAAAVDLVAGSVTRSTQTAGDLLHWYQDRYDDEGLIWDFDDALARLKTVTTGDVMKMAQTVVRAGERGVSFVGRLTDEQADRYARQLGFIKA